MGRLSPNGGKNPSEEPNVHRKPDPTLSRPFPALEIEESGLLHEQRAEMANVLQAQFGKGNFDSPLLPYMRHGATEFSVLKSGTKGETMHGFLAATQLPGNISYIDQVAANPRNHRKGAVSDAFRMQLDRLDRGGQDSITVASPNVPTFDAYIEQGGVAYGLSAEGEYRGRYPLLRRVRGEAALYATKWLQPEEIRQLAGHGSEVILDTEIGEVPLRIEALTLDRAVSMYDFHASPEGRTLYARLQDLFADGWVITRCVRGSSHDERILILERERLDQADPGARERLEKAWSMLHDMRAA